MSSITLNPLPNVEVTVNNIEGGELAQQGTAGVNLSALRVVVFNSSDELIYAEPNSTTLNQSLMFIESSVASGQNVTGFLRKVVTDPSWNWNLNEIIWLGANGTLTQTAPSSGVARQVATPLTDKTILFAPREGFEL